LIPAVSPKKTVEGAVGGVIASSITAMIAGTAFGLGVPLIILAGVGLILGGLGQMGDLAESLMKRQAGVKDSGTFIRGHGGVLDRVDALLITLAAGIYVTAAVDRWFA
jgi:phosphatidate cytidylyltransferase